MRVMHLIDSLSLGGAERMAVNLCNVLVDEGCEMHLCATRKTGPLESFLDSRVHLFKLNKKGTFDLPAMLRLSRYVKRNRVDILHAHSSSFFAACLVRFLSSVKVVWHDHNGQRIVLSSGNKKIRYFSRFFSAVFCVNDTLRDWAVHNLHTAKDSIHYLPNFPLGSDSSAVEGFLPPGCKENRIVCVANLRVPKDHSNLVRAMYLVAKSNPECHLLLVGGDYEDEYSMNLKKLIVELGLADCISILGKRSDVGGILGECAIGVVASESEGLPVSLLEYGLAGLAVVSTDVGECKEVLEDGKYGLVVPAKDEKALAKTLISLLSDKSMCRDYGERYQAHIDRCYSGVAIAKKVSMVYKSILSDV